MTAPLGYAGKLLRVDLSRKKIRDETLNSDILQLFLGGVGLGLKILYDEVQPGIEWSDPENRLILASGPLGGTNVGGSGTFSVVTKGCLTDGATGSQANGFFGAFLRFCGYDAIVIQGKASQWSYLYIDEKGAAIKNASSLLGKDTWETERLIKDNHPGKQMSVFGIGPAGENLVKFACIAGDNGHVAAHNGVGAVMGAKKLKAIAVVRGSKSVALADREQLKALSEELLEKVKADKAGRRTFDWGTSMIFTGFEKFNYLPVKNYTATSFPDHARFMGEYLRSVIDTRPRPCWACRFHHCHLMNIKEGPYAGFVGEEPEYEQMAAWGPQVGNTDPIAAIVLSNDVDRLGMDTNEAGWIMGMVLEGYQKGLLDKKATGGLEMTWGNVAAIREMLRKIANREGIGNVLADGVKRAAQQLGGEFPNIGIFTMKGNTPRGHDHRAQWMMLMDTAVSDSSVDASTSFTPPAEVGLPEDTNLSTPVGLALMRRKLGSKIYFDDCLGTCRFNQRGVKVEFISKLVSSATGLVFTAENADETGFRILNLFRCFNLRHGINAGLDRPSPRYSSTPADGLAKGKTILPVWPEVLKTYYRTVGWDEASGKPLPETLKKLQLDFCIKDVEG